MGNTGGKTHTNHIEAGKRLIWRSRWLFVSALLPLTILLLPVLNASEKSWYEIRSPHFTVLYDGSEGNARRLATHLEQFRAAFQQSLPGLSLDGGVPVTVVATWDEETYRRLCLRDEAKPNAQMGVWHTVKARDGSYAVIWADTRRHSDVHDWGDPIDFRLFDAYTSLIGMTRLRWLPFWLRVGLTKFAAAASVNESKVDLGRSLPGYARVLWPSMMIPLRDVLMLNVVDMEDVKPQDRYYLYAESWGLVHYFLLGADGSYKEQLTRYVKLLQEGQTREQAASEAFGDLKTLEKNLLQYFGGRALHYQEYDVRASGIQSELQAMKLDAKEASLAEANVMVRFGNRRGARELLQGVLQQGPNSAAARETLGLCALGDANFDEAASEFTAALAVNPNLVEARYYSAMIANRDHPKGKPNPVTVSELRKVVSEAPSYSPALLELARLLVEEQGPSEEATSLARRAAEAEPYLPGYFLNYGYIQLQAGHAQEAEQAARYVMRIAPEGQELEDGRALLEQSDGVVRAASGGKSDSAPALPTEASSAVPPPKVEDGKATIRGIVESTSCQGAAKLFAINSDGAKLSFDFANLVHSNLPQTMWIPTELFPLCKHLPGHAIEVRFKPPVSSLGTTEALGIILRDSYPGR